MADLIKVKRTSSGSTILRATCDMWLEQGSGKYDFVLRVGTITVEREDSNVNTVIEMDIDIGGENFYAYTANGTSCTAEGGSVSCTANSNGEVWVPITIDTFHMYSGTYGWLGYGEGNPTTIYGDGGYYQSGLISFNVYCKNTDGSIVASYTNKAYGSTINLPSTAPTNLLSKSRTSTFNITGNINGGNGSNFVITGTNNYTISYTAKGWINGSTVKSLGSSYTITQDITFTIGWNSSESLSSSTNNKISDLEAYGTPTKSPDGSGMFEIPLYIDSSLVLLEKITAGSTNSYTFGGWSATVNGTKLASSTAFTSATVVYAIWNTNTTSITTVNLPIPKKDMVAMDTFTVTQLVDADAYVANQTLTAKRGKTYVFKGWAKNGTIVADSNNTYYTPSGDATALIGQWEEVVATEQIKLDVPTKAGFIFLGWEATRGSKNYVTDYTMLYTPTKSINLYAVFKPRYIAEIFIYHNGRWCLSNPHIRHMDIFNESINSV